VREVIAHLKSISPYSQSRHYEVEKLAKERPDDYEKRTWRERMHVSAEGYVFIPPMAFKNCLSAIAKYLGEQIPGKGKSTFTKHFESGVMVLEGLQLPVKKESIPGEWLFVPADGKRGSGRRVSKCFPLIADWHGHVTFHILDDTITKEVFAQHLEQAGKFIGIGRFRPSSNGYYGRFAVEKLEWIDEA
jgi:hypothetical protein